VWLLLPRLEEERGKIGERVCSRETDLRSPGRLHITAAAIPSRFRARGRSGAASLLSIAMLPEESMRRSMELECIRLGDSSRTIS